MSERASGPDVSVWQDDNSTPQQIDFGKMVAAGADFVGIKVSQGTWVDPDYVYNWANAREHDLPRWGYHYLDWDKPAQEQAKVFASALKQDPPELLPVLDYEKKSGAPEKARAIAFAKVFVEEAEQLLGTELGVYTSPGFWAGWGSTAGFWGKRKLLIANYEVETPSVPKPWENWTFWQHTSHGDGLHFGAESKNIDLNWYNGTRAEMAAEFGLPELSVPSPDLTPGPSPDLTPGPSPAPQEGASRGEGGVRLKVLRPVTLRMAAHTGAKKKRVLAAGEIISIDSVGGTDAWVHSAELDGWLALRHQGITYLETVE